MKVLSGSALKLLAVVTMLIDHIASHLMTADVVLFSVLGHNVRLYPLLRGVGRMAFPLFAFLLVEGFVHTHSRQKYGLNLLVFTLLSEVPWDLLHHGVWFSFKSQSVFVTLLLGFAFILLLYALREHEVLRILSAFVLNMQWWSLLAFVPISLYNGKRGFIHGKVLKYAFYAFYPLHMLVLYLFKFQII